MRMVDPGALNACVFLPTSAQDGAVFENRVNTTSMSCSAVRGEPKETFEGSSLLLKMCNPPVCSITTKLCLTVETCRYICE